MSPFTVSKIVGHTSVNMTNYYTHLEQDYVADEFRKFAAKYDEGKVPACQKKNKENYRRILLDKHTKY